MFDVLLWWYVGDMCEWFEWFVQYWFDVVCGVVFDEFGIDMLLFGVWLYMFVVFECVCMMLLFVFDVCGGEEMCQLLCGFDGCFVLLGLSGLLLCGCFDVLFIGCNFYLVDMCVVLMQVVWLFGLKFVQ